MVSWSAVSWSHIVLALLAGFAVCEAGQYLTTAVLHRGLTHGAIRFPPWIHRSVAVYLWLTACIPPLTWIAAHRHHHASSDTEEDPHSPVRRGVWPVLLLSWYYVTRWARGNREYAERHYLRAFRHERLLHWLDRQDVCYANFYLQIALSVLAGPVGVAFWVGRLPTYMLLSGYVNSIGHTYGERPYDNPGTDAAGPWQVFFAYLTGGEPLGHNFHHRFPASPRFCPQRFDPGFWFATRVLRGRPKPSPPEVGGKGSGRGDAGPLSRLLENTGVPCEVVLPSGRTLRFGAGEPRFRAIFRSERVLRRTFDELALGRAYLEGDLDLEGDLWSVFEIRERLRDPTRLGAALRFLVQLFLIAPTRLNRRSIRFHYDLGDDFYHSFLDTRYRFYSQGLFQDESETLEEASEHKLETLFAALELQSGMRLLDIGGGWGGVTRYCGARGIHVTSLTLAKDSYRYIRNLLDTTGLSGEVHFQDFLEHRPERPYDAITILGVIEHLPYYRRFCERAWECLAPGGRLYLDASAGKEKLTMSNFTRQYIWHGIHAPLALPDLLQELLWNGFEVEEVRRETRDYELTLRHWAQRLDAARDLIVEGWGEKTYRAFRIYLWGACHAMHTDRLQAYHLVARRRPEPGPRPGLARRIRSFVRGFR